MQIRTISRGLFLSCAIVVGAGCAAPAETAEPGEAGESGTGGESVGTTASAITNGTLAVTFMQQQSVAIETPVPGGDELCTGFIIGPRHVVTASHCKLKKNVTSVRFYNGSTTPTGARETGTLVTAIAMRPGVDPTSDQKDDSNGDFADFAVLTLASPIPATSTPATLALSYAGENASGFEVGRGQHDGFRNPSDQLRFSLNHFFSSDASGGYFYMNDSRGNGGDSGGPVFANGKVQGVMSGEAWVPFGFRDKFTSTTYHLQFILDAMSYVGSSFKLPNTALSGGTVMSISFMQSARMCEYACDHDSSCHGFTVMGGTLCTLRSALSNDTVTIQGAISGIR